MREISFLGVKINFSSGEITLLGYKFRILTLVLIYILYLIMFGHLLCSCSTMSLGEIREYFVVEGEENIKPLLA
jgi:hypothetical protein